MVDSPVSGGNVCEADKGGAGLAGLAAKQIGGLLNPSVACGDTSPYTGETLDADCHVVGAVPYKEMEKKCKKYCKPIDFYKNYDIILA